MRSAEVAGSDWYTVRQVRWGVLPGFSAEGLLVEPAKDAVANVIVFPDASDTPENVIGGGTPDKYRGVRRMASHGFRILIPTPISRAKLVTEDRRLKRSDQTYREWIYRQAFHMGRHVIGYEVQTVMAGVDWLRERYPSEKIGVTGHGEGGLVAFYAGAVDTRIDSVTVSGYFGSRENVWQEPIYRNVWGLLREFGDSEIASLIRPRRFHIVHSDHPAVQGHKGATTQPTKDSVLSEFRRVRFVEMSMSEYPAERSHQVLAFLGVLTSSLGGHYIGDDYAYPGIPLAESVRAARHQRVFKGMESHVQNLVRTSEHVRTDFFVNDVLPELKNRRWTTLKTHKLQNAETFVNGAKAFRKRFHEEAMGKFDERMKWDPQARSRKIAETDKWVAYDVVLQVYSEL
ncbi:MAG: hypothetical protein ACPGVU_17495, partial [Limisphaerales bacterium]